MKHKILSLLLLGLICSIGNVWADATHAEPALTTVASRTFLNLQNTPSNVTVSTDEYSNYGPGYFITNKEKTSGSWWGFTGTFKSTSNSYQNVSGSVGFHSVGSSSSDEFYQILQMRTGDNRMTQMDFYVTGTTQIGFQWKNGGTTNKYLTFTIYEMDVTGATATDGDTPAATVTGTTTSDAQQYAAATNLDGSKYYHIVVTPLNTSNINFYGLTFKHAPATTYSITYSLNGGSGTTPTETAKKEGATFTLHDGTTDITAPDGQEFYRWKDQDGYYYAGGATYTMPAKAVTLTAQWITPCAASVPGAISKGTLSSGTLTLNAEGSPASGDTWYWQTSTMGTDKTHSGSSFGVTAAGTYYVRSYNSSSDCWSEEQSIEVVASDLLERYAITYNKGANGTGSIAAGEKTEGVAFTLSSEMFTRDGYLQIGWATTDGGTKAYDLGGSYTTDAAQTFYPVWAEKYTYVAEFSYASGTPAGWTLATDGYTNTSATAAYVGAFKANSETTVSGQGIGDDNIAFAKNNGAIATYDLGFATTVSSVTGNLIFGSSKDQTGTIEYLGSDGSTVKHSFNVAHSKTNWGSNSVNHTTVVPNIRYIRIKGTSGAWMVMTALSVTYADPAPRYTVTYALNGGSGTTPTETEKKEGATFTLHNGTTGITAPAGKEFSKWKDQDAYEYIGGASYTMPAKNVTLTAQWIDEIVRYAITEGSHSNGTITISATEEAEGEEITLTATPNEDYLFDSWDVYETGNSSNKVTVTSNTFTMPAHAVTVNATFVSDMRKKVLYLTSNGSVNAEDKVCLALKEEYNVKVKAFNADSVSVSDYDLVVFHESIGGSNYNAGLVNDAIAADVPVLNTKSYFYGSNSNASERWGWGLPNAGTSVSGATLNPDYANTASHPLFAGVTITEGVVTLFSSEKAKAMQPVTNLASGKEGYTIAITPNATSGNGVAIHELTPSQRGVSNAKYLMISIGNENGCFELLTANGQKLIKNAAAYLIDNDASWTPIPSSVSGTISDAGWSTFSSIYPLDLTQAIENGSAYYASATNGSTVTVATAPSQVVPAGEGLMIKGSAGETFTIQTSSNAGSAISGNLLVGLPNGGTIVSSDNAYVFAKQGEDVGFYRMTAGDVPAGKAYLSYAAPGEAPSALRIVEAENNATSIEAIESNEDVVKFFENGNLYIMRNGVVYDAVGRIVR